MTKTEVCDQSCVRVLRNIGNIESVQTIENRTSGEKLS